MHSLHIKSQELYFTLTSQIDVVKLEKIPDIEKAEKIIGFVLDAIGSLRKVFCSYTKIKQEDEIYFFKMLKPLFLAEYILYMKIFRLHSFWPMGSQEVKQAYLEDELAQTDLFFGHHHHFFCYYQSGSTVLDYLYFTRKYQDKEPHVDRLIAMSDPAFNTSRDNLLGQMHANIAFLNYLEDQMNILQAKDNEGEEIDKPMQLLQWTGSKAALVEFIYGFHYMRVFNDGAVDLKTIAAVFGAMFNIDVSSYSDIFQHIRRRKMERTKNVDSMKTSLLENMEAMD